MTEAWLVLVRDLAWPIVALIGLMILGPMGLLKDIVKTLTLAIGELNKAVSDFRESTINLRSDMESFRSMGGSVSSEFALRVADLQKEIRATAEQLEKIEKSTSATLSASRDILRNTVETGQEEIDPGFTPEPDPNERPQDGGLTPDQMYDSIRAHWSGLVELLRSKLQYPEDFDGRRVGEIALDFTDGRRRVSIDKELGEQISGLHSQFRKFVRLYQSRDQWLTHEVYNSFVAKVGDAARGLT